MKTAAPLPRTLPKTFAELSELVVPLINDGQSYADALPLLDRLVVTPLNAAQQQFLDLLTDQLEAYEKEHGPEIPEPMNGLQALIYLLEQNQMTAADLAGLLDVHRSAAFRLLNGERSLTVPHIRKLCQRFCVSADLFVR